MKLMRTERWILDTGPLVVGPVPIADGSASIRPLSIRPSWPSRAPLERAAWLVSVREEEDIVNAVLAARDAGRTVRAVGSFGSKNTCFRTTGAALRMAGYNRIIALNGNRVEAQAGVTVRDLNETLRQHGLSIPTQGEWLGSTVAGAVATGVHGGSSVHGILSTSVAALRFVLADGTAVTVRAEDELFRQAAVSLGTLGITSTVTFECVEQFYLELVSEVIPFRQYLRDFTTLTNGNEFFSAIWVPTADRVVIFRANRVAKPPRVIARRQRYSFATLALSALSRGLNIHAISNRVFAHRAVDTADRILTPLGENSRHVRWKRALSRWREAEFAVSVQRAGDVLEDLNALLSRHRRALGNPVGLRCSAADGFTLSPCYDRDTFWLAVFYRDESGLSSELTNLFEEHDARSHWGKHVALRPHHLRRQFANWDEFSRTRRRLDPAGMLSNAFTRRFAL